MMRQVHRVGILALGIVLGLGLVSLAGSADAVKGTFTQKSPVEVWEITFDGKSKFSVSLDGKVGVEGSYKVTKDEIELTDEKGPFASKEDGPGIYKWKLADNKLTFIQVKDKNPGRSKALTAAPWELKKK